MGFNVNVVLLEDMKLKFKCCGIPEKEDSQVPIAQSGLQTLDLKIGFQTQDPKKRPQVLDPEKTDAYTTSKILDLKKQAVIANY